MPTFRSLPIHSPTAHFESLDRTFIIGGGRRLFVPLSSAGNRTARPGFGSFHINHRSVVSLKIKSNARGVWIRAVVIFLLFGLLTFDGDNDVFGISINHTSTQQHKELYEGGPISA